MPTHGGKREGSGRTPLPEDQKKVAKTIYISPALQSDIEQYAQGSNFSEKYADLLSTQIERRKRASDRTVKFIDLFAGLGGIRLGFETAFKKKGFNPVCVFSSEIKDYAIKAYKKYYKEEEIAGDITKIPASDIEDFDFLLAGFPCQPFSAAGLGLGFEDTRGTLFFEIERILKEKKPYGFLLENVEGLMNHDGGRTLSIIVDHLKKLGYFVSYRLIDSQYFGLAQSRKRVYIVGSKDAHISLDNFDEHTSVLGDILETGLPTVDSAFTQKLFAHFTPEQVVGKAIKDKRGGADNIHSWEIGLKGDTTKEQAQFLNLLLLERRKRRWAAEIGIDWMDGMPLTEQQIATFFPRENLKEFLDELVDMGYLTLEYPRKKRMADVFPTKQSRRGIISLPENFHLNLPRFLILKHWHRHWWRWMYLILELLTVMESADYLSEKVKDSVVSRKITTYRS